MRVLCVIPHYYRPGRDSESNKSLRASARENRIGALSETICSLHAAFGSSTFGLDHSRRTAYQAAAPYRCQVDVVVVVLEGANLLDRIPVSPRFYMMAKAQTAPETLGFAAHLLMREMKGKYDYYCYVEDDIRVDDPYFFRKLALFNRHFGNEALLQPNRFEASIYAPLRKVYVDYDLHPAFTEPYQNVAEVPSLELEFLGDEVVFTRTLYPSAGCFFLNAEQFETWIATPHYLDMDTSYIGSLDSASILSVMKTFRIYKPHLDHAGFLEVEHLSPRWIHDIGKDIPVSLRETPFQDLPEN